MPKFKVKRSSTWVDMTAMCDVAFLLLSFFILTAKFKPTEIVPIKSPTSRATEEVADKFVTLTVDKDGKVYMACSAFTSFCLFKIISQNKRKNNSSVKKSLGHLLVNYHQLSLKVRVI